MAPIVPYFFQWVNASCCSLLLYERRREAKPWFATGARLRCTDNKNANQVSRDPINLADSRSPFYSSMNSSGCVIGKRVHPRRFLCGTHSHRFSWIARSWDRELFEYSSKCLCILWLNIPSSFIDIFSILFNFFNFPFWNITIWINYVD